MYLVKFILVALALIAGFAFRADGQTDTPQGITYLVSPPQPVAARLKAITLTLDFNTATLAEAVNFLRVESKRLDPTHQTIDFIISPDAAAASRPVTLTLNKVTMEQALQSVCELAGVKYAIEARAVRLLAPDEKPADDATLAIAAPPDDPAAQATEHKLRQIIIDKVNFQNLDIAAAVQFLGAKSRELDPDHIGVNFVLDLGAPGANIHRQLNLMLEQVPLSDLLRIIEQQTNLRATIGDNIVTFEP